MVSVSLKPSAQKYERDKRQEDAQKVTRQKEKQIKKVGIENQKSTKTRYKPPKKGKPSRRIEMPPRTEQVIIDILETPIEGSPLNPVTDMRIVPLTIIRLNSEIQIPVLDLF